MKITDIIEGKRNKNRVNIYADGEFAFSVYIDTMLEMKLICGMELSEEEVSFALSEDEKRYAMETALKFLSYRMRSRKEIETKLREKEISKGSIDLALSELEKLGYVDDEEFAKAFIEQMKDRSGRIVMKEKLLEKGIDRSVAEELLSKLDQRETVFERARLLKEKYKNDDERKAKQKMFRALMTKGFDFDSVKEAVNAAFDEEGEYDDEI